jgi:hypothetical protein
MSTTVVPGGVSGFFLFVGFFLSRASFGFLTPPFPIPTPTGWECPRIGGAGAEELDEATWAEEDGADVLGAAVDAVPNDWA